MDETDGPRVTQDHPGWRRDVDASRSCVGAAAATPPSGRDPAGAPEIQTGWEAPGAAPETDRARLTRWRADPKLVLTHSGMRPVS